MKKHQDELKRSRFHNNVAKWVGIGIALFLIFAALFGAATATAEPLKMVRFNRQETNENVAQLLERQKIDGHRMDELSRVVAESQYGRSLPRVKVPHGPLVCRELFAYRANGKTKQPDWVAYIVALERFDNHPQRRRNWHNASCVYPELVLESRPDDFGGTSETDRPSDRGHTNPLASVSSHPAWASVNEYGTIVIQSPGANRGPVLGWEESNRDFARNGHTPFCVVVPIYDHPDVEPEQVPELTHADEGYTAPEAFGLVSRFPRGSDLADSVYCYIVPQTAKQTDNFRTFATSLEAVEEMSGVDLR